MISRIRLSTVSSWSTVTTRMSAIADASSGIRFGTVPDFATDHVTRRPFGKSETSRSWPIWCASS